MRKIIFSFLFLCFCAILSGQTAKNMRINEVMPFNTLSITDQYGQRNGWIEIFNPAFSFADIKGCFITNNREVLKNMSAPERMRLMYQVPKGNLETRIHPRQHILFFTDGLSNRGLFHTDFQLNCSTSNWIALFNADGITIIDSITIPALATNYSFARFTDHEGKTIWHEVKPENVTAGTTNLIESGESKVSKFKRMDELGFGMTITAMLIVFSTLMILFIGFKYISKGISLVDKLKQKKTNSTAHNAKKTHNGDEEELAALAMALHQHFSIVHDYESDMLTIERSESTWRLSQHRRYER